MVRKRSDIDTILTPAKKDRRGRPRTVSLITKYCPICNKRVTSGSIYRKTCSDKCYLEMLKNLAIIRRKEHNRLGKYQGVSKQYILDVLRTIPCKLVASQLIGISRSRLYQILKRGTENDSRANTN